MDNVAAEASSTVARENRASRQGTTAGGSAADREHPPRRTGTSGSASKGFGQRIVWLRAGEHRNTFARGAGKMRQLWLVAAGQEHGRRTSISCSGPGAACRGTGSAQNSCARGLHADGDASRHEHRPGQWCHGRYKVCISPDSTRPWAINQPRAWTGFNLSCFVAPVQAAGAQDQERIGVVM